MELTTNDYMTIALTDSYSVGDEYCCGAMLQLWKNAEGLEAWQDYCDIIFSEWPYPSRPWMADACYYYWRKKAEGPATTQSGQTEV